MTAELKPILEVWLQVPNTLILRVDEERLIYVPTPGRSMEMPMSGEWIIWQDPGRAIRPRAGVLGWRQACSRTPGGFARAGAIGSGNWWMTGCGLAALYGSRACLRRHPGLS